MEILIILIILTILLGVLWITMFGLSVFVSLKPSYKENKKYKNNGYFLPNDFESLYSILKDKIFEKTKKQNEEIQKLRKEIELIPNIEELKPIIEIKKNLIKQLEEKIELIKAKEKSIFYKELPVLVYIDKSDKELVEISKLKDLRGFYQNIIKNVFNRDFAFTHLGGLISISKANFKDEAIPVIISNEKDLEKIKEHINWGKGDEGDKSFKFHLLKEFV